MNPQDLLDHLTGLVWPVVEDATRNLRDPLADLDELPDAGAGLQGKLLEPLSPPPAGNALLSLLHEVLGDLAAGPLRWHGWQRTSGSDRGLAVVLTQGASRAVLALSPGPFVDLVVTAGAALSHTATAGDWELTCSVSTGPVWEASWSPGQATVAATGSATVALTRAQPVDLTPVPGGPGVSWSSLEAHLTVSPGTPASYGLDLRDFTASILPDALADILGGGGQETAPADLGLAIDALEGLRFTDGSLRFPLPGGIDLPGLTVRGLAVELGIGDGGAIELTPSMSVTASLPAAPATMTIDGVHIPVPITISGSKIGVHVPDVVAPLPDGIGIELSLPPITGGGMVKKTGPGAYGGILDLDLGTIHVQAMGLLKLPQGGNDLSLLVLMSATFPPPGIQLGFGFALDGVGGLVGINRRVETDRVRELVSDGNADRVMFPENALSRADAIIGSLVVCFPDSDGHHVAGPMVQINWGGRLVRVSLAVLIELPDPVRVILLGRVVVAIPDPAVPIVRLQASVYGKLDPSVPMLEILVSLAGSYVGGVPISGEIYALFRGGRDPVFVLSAGGFHPQYVRPAGVPALRRLSMDLGGGFLGLRGEAYLALTSNSLQFGAMIQLDATIAGCGVEGYLGLDALFKWEPVLAFSVQVQAGVAVLAFGERLASVALRFTLEGPGAWHAFGTGSISILWWDVDLDFDVRWGTPPALTPPAPDPVEELRIACSRRDAWSIEAPPASRIPLELTADARQDVSAGRVALPDAQLRLSQEILPLDLTINRFHRISIPEQTWKLGKVKVAPNDNTAHNTPVQADFVPGEFLTLTDDEQLGRPAFEKHDSGVELTDTSVQAGGAKPVDDSYETDYEVDPDWFDVPPGRHTSLSMLIAFSLEGYARQLSTAERVHRWQLEQQRFVGSSPLVVLK